MKRIYLLTFGLLLFFVSCENNTQNEVIDSVDEEEHKATILVIEFTYASGLRVGDKVLSRGVKIGEVIKIDLSETGQSVFVSTKIKEEQNIPKGSEFYLASIDILGTKGIDVYYSDSKIHYQCNDTIIGLQQEIDSTLFKSINESAEKMIKSTDSLIKLGEINIDIDSLFDKVTEQLEMK